MNQLLAKNLRDVFFGGNWTGVNLKDTLHGINFMQANQKIHDLHTIAELVFHINYFLTVLLTVLSNNKLNAHDKYSFDMPPINNEEDWQKQIELTLSTANQCATELVKMDKNLEDTFVDPRYGSYITNILGIIEHSHYHLGQIAIIKKLLQKV